MSTVAIFIVPESPKYLWSAKRFEEAKKNIKFIARFNRVVGFNPKYKFEKEIIEEKKERKVISAEYNSKSLQDPQLLHSKMADSTQAQDLKRNIHTKDPIYDNTLDNQALLAKEEQIEIQEDKNNLNNQTADGEAVNESVDLPAKEEPSGALKDLFKNKEYLQNMLVLSFLWVVASFDYFLINFQMKYIEGDMYINTIVSCTSEVVAYIVSGALYKVIGTKISFLGAFTLAIIGSVFYIIFGEAHKSLVPVMVLGAKFGISGAFNLVYLANTLFPPIYASTTFGIFNIFARLASMLAP